VIFLSVIISNHKELVRFTTAAKSLSCLSLDFFAVTGVTTLDIADYNDYGDYPRLVDWLKRMKELSFYKECNESGSKFFADAYQGKLTIDPGNES